MEEEFDTHGSLMCVCESRTACAYRLGTWLLLDDFVQFLAGFMEVYLQQYTPTSQHHRGYSQARFVQERDSEVPAVQRSKDGIVCTLIEPLFLLLYLPSMVHRQSGVDSRPKPENTTESAGFGGYLHVF
jgi:hypothetical protein